MAADGAREGEAATHLILYARAYCHLCHDMAEALQPLVESYGCTVEWVDVDEDPQLDARFDEKVPVLMAGEVELCHHFLDVEGVRAHLEAAKAGLR